MRSGGIFGLVVSFLCCAQAFGQGRGPQFTNVAVHDPSVLKAGRTWYVFGSHMGAAKSDDLIHWTQLSTDAGKGNTLVPNVGREMKEVLDWAGVDTFWAPDVIQLADGKFYMYYCASRIDSPRAGLGIAVASKPEGPYKNLGVILKSGMWNEKSPDGRIYDPTIHPNAVDPDVFFDTRGKLWMVYGSYSGGIFILELDPKTGFPKRGQGYGERLMGGNHSRIEAPFVLYSPESQYYYLFVSFGGLGSDGGYNIRVARSRKPEGPYVDSEGTEMTKVAGKRGTFFDDPAIEPHGVKLIGNFRWSTGDGAAGYVSPGHNSAYFDPATKKYFLFFHTRFPGRGEMHEVRVHQMFLNREGWLVVAPHRYAGETIGNYTSRDIVGDYRVILFPRKISPEITDAVAVTLNENGRVTGALEGTWTLSNGNYIVLKLGDVTYSGRVLRQWDDARQKPVFTFSALAGNGTPVWGSHE